MSKKTKKISGKTTKKTTNKKPKKGLGDVVEVITEATGIKAAVKMWEDITGKDCGCDERKERLNNLFRNRISKPKCLNEKQYNDLSEILVDVRSTKSISSEQRKEVAKIYSEIFGTRYVVWCSVCHEEWAGRIKDLERVLSEYKEDGDE